MTFTRRTFHVSALAATSAFLLGAGVGPAFAAGAADLDRDAAQALAALYKASPAAELVGKKAKAILVFPKITKAGLVFGGGYGEGVLLQGAKVTEYYNSVSASWGWQIGVETSAYAVFLMSDKAVKYLATSKGWEIGVGPSMVLVDEGVAKNLTTTTLKDDAYAFVTDQRGLMINLSLQGTKISRIKR